MGKNLNVIILVSMITLSIMLAGCVDNGQDISPMFKSIPEVQQFLQDHPNAKITVTYWSEEEVLEISDDISIQCDKNINPRALYKATISEGNLKVVSWIDAETQIIICTITQESSDPTPPIPTATPTPPIPTATPTPPIPTATPTPPIPTATPTPPIPILETTEMSTGLYGFGQGGGVWYGAYEYFSFTEVDEDYIMQVEVQSNEHELRIELWEGLIGQNDHYWWTTHFQEATSTGTGNDPQIEPNPQLCWTIKPGDYTLFFAGFNHDGEIIPYTINYKIEYLTYDVVICDVLYDPPGPEPDNEFIKLCNQGSSTVDIGDWRLTDGEGTYIIPSGTILTADSSWSVFGSTYNPTSYTQGLYLANSHDEVILYNKDGKKVDEYHW